MVIFFLKIFVINKKMEKRRFLFFKNSVTKVKYIYKYISSKSKSSDVVIIVDFR